jgi:hypothetical protein
MMGKYLVGAATALGLVAAVLVDVANAGTISIGWRQDGGAITTVAGSGVSDSFSIGAAILTGLLATLPLLVLVA